MLHQLSVDLVDTKGVHATIAKYPVICFSHLRWDFVYQRPQHLLSRFAREHDVVFIEEPIFEDIGKPELRRAMRGERVEICVPVLPHGLTESAKVHAQRELLDQRLAELGGESRIFWYYTPMALLFSRHLNVDVDVVVFDSMDELSAFRGAPKELLALEEELMARADVVFTGGHSLFEAKQHRHHNIHAFPSSVDTTHFERGRADDRPEPTDQSDLPHPRLGFFGVIDERFDCELLKDVAAARPDWSFVMIGPVVKIDPADLPQAPNIHWMGPRAYQDLPDYIGGWNVGFMPFALNESTRFISPTKTPEFLAAGVPVVSTAIHDVVRSYGADGFVRIATDAHHVISHADDLMVADRGAMLEKINVKLAATSWDSTFDEIYAHVAAVRGVRSSGASAIREAV